MIALRLGEVLTWPANTRYHRIFESPIGDVYACDHGHPGDRITEDEAQRRGLKQCGLCFRGKWTRKMNAS